MTDAQEISGPEFGPASGGAPKQLVVLLHGWGADGNDLIGLAPVWSRILPDAVFASPHAPFTCDIGMGRQWFSLDDRRPALMLASVHTAAPFIERFIDATLSRHGLDDSALAVVGFSQGTMMSLHVMPRRAKPCACVVGYSGALLGGEHLAAEATARPPVLLIHGEADPVVGAAALGHAAEGLRAAAFDVDTILRPGLGHGIDEAGMAAGARFMARGLGVASAV